MDTSRVEFRGETTFFDLNWEKLVLKPADVGHFIEAFASADALIDKSAESILRQIYNSFESQNLINQFSAARGQMGFDGLVMLLILKRKEVIDKSTYNRAVDFKGKRNLIVHDIKAEYNLVEYKDYKQCKSQEDYDRKAREIALIYLSKAFDVFCALHESAHRVSGKEKDYLLKGLSTIA